MMSTPFTQTLQSVLPFFAGLSLITFCISLLCIPWLVSQLPQNYFQNPKNKKETVVSKSHISYPIIFLLRNLIGFVLFTAGIAMLFLPGQGIITMIIGIGVMSFPYKQYLIYRATRPATIQSTMDWIRKKTGKESFCW
ncbi:PGPGW domain-containing protein [Desulfopila sp. IMCC35008]|uniref:PGPGW domain-containing protein n=1 Tax=Desulfopila sp. IMCC35008 TaxID=2653858 RepID=UPI0013D89D14